MTRPIVVLTAPPESRPLIANVADPAEPAAMTNETRYRPEPRAVAVFRTPARPGWVNVTDGEDRKGSTVVNVTVSVWPVRSVVAETATLNASTRIVRVRVVVPSLVVASTRAT